MLPPHLLGDVPASVPPTLRTRKERGGAEKKRTCEGEECAFREQHHFAPCLLYSAGRGGDSGL